MITYTAAISACVNSKDQWQKVVKLLAEMQAQGIQPNAMTYIATFVLVKSPRSVAVGVEASGR